MSICFVSNWVKDRYYDVHFTYLGDDGEEYIYDLNHEIDI